jgi:putative peptide zinc metalloprotease protein
MVTMSIAQRKEPETPLPRLRHDVRVETAGVDHLGFAKVVVFDPVQGTYFQISWPLSATLLCWRDCGTVEALTARVQAAYAAAITDESVAALGQFLQSNQLIELDQAGAWRQMAGKALATKPKRLMWLAHNYLFIRIPLVRPQAALERLLPMFSVVFAARFWFAIGAVGLVGLYLSMRQWSALQSAFSDAFKMQGLVIYAVVLFALKAIHELGHGLTTVRYGCRVPSMGVAFMLGTPVLYTDTSDSWRLGRRSERLAIVFGGIAAEMVVATIALAVWPFLSDGIARQICFAIVTSAVVSSVLINLNPFMRYDGYFALSDVLRVPNLQARAFDLALWRLRELLFDLRRPAPEVLAPNLEKTLIVYAVLTAVYRVFLYMAIAAMVYHIGFKVLGILLWLFEVVFLILLPIGRELMHWWESRAEILASRRIRYAVLGPVAAAAALCLPWVTVVEIPAVLQAKRDEPIHLPSEAMIVEAHVTNGTYVTAGQTLFIAASPTLDHQHARAIAEAAAISARLMRLNASDKERSERLTLESRHRRAQNKTEAIERLMQQLTVRAPFDGQVVDLDPAALPGTWQSKKRELARIVSTVGVRARGVVGDTDLARITVGNSSRFVADDSSIPILPLRLTTIATAGNGRLSEPVLAEKFGGPVQADEKNGELIHRQGWVDVHFDADVAAPTQAVRGVVVASASGVSPLRLAFNQIARVLVREQGF